MNAAPPDLERLVRAAQSRDHEAFIALAEFVRPRLWARALARSADHQRAEDLVQETLLRAYRSLADLREPAKFISWILTIIDRLAPREAAPRQEISTSDELALVEPGGESARLLLEAGEWIGSREELQAAVARLDPEEREILALRFTADLDATEIAEQLGSTPGAIRTRLCRTLEKLRQMLGVKS